VRDDPQELDGAALVLSAPSTLAGFQYVPGIINNLLKSAWKMALNISIPNNTLRQALTVESAYSGHDSEGVRVEWSSTVLHFDDTNGATLSLSLSSDIFSMSGEQNGISSVIT
jgi:hypothetical protein